MNLILTGVITFTKCLSNGRFSVFCLCPAAVNTQFRDNLTLSNANAVNASSVSEHMNDVINGRSNPGDALFLEKRI